MRSSELVGFLRRCRAAHVNPLVAAFNTARYRAGGKNVVAGQGIFMAGLDRIDVAGRLELALTKLDFVHPGDKTVINVRGRLAFEGDYVLSQGCRVDVGPGAEASFGPGFANAYTKFIVMRSLRVGRHCVIGWNSTFIDDDQHALAYPGRRERASAIRLGDRVWIGANVTVLKGTSIGDGCVVAAGAVVSGAFDEPHCLIAGNPARVVRREVRWAVNADELARQP